MDYDKQFQEDLEKATALSLETLALDQFRRNKLQYSSVNDVSTTSTALKTSTCKRGFYLLFAKQNTKLSFFCFSAQYNLETTTASSRSTTRPRPGSFGNSTPTSFGSVKPFPTSSSNGSLAPPPTAPQRNQARKTYETDLISFSNPSEDTNANSLLLANEAASVTSPSNDSHANFKQMVDEIHR